MRVLQGRNKQADLQIFENSVNRLRISITVSAESCGPLPCVNIFIFFMNLTHVQKMNEKVALDQSREMDCSALVRKYPSSSVVSLIRRAPPLDTGASPRVKFHNSIFLKHDFSLQAVSLSDIWGFALN